MSKLLKGVIAVLMITGLTGCVNTSDIKVESVKSEKVDLKGYKTYKIIDGSGIMPDTKVAPDRDIDVEMQQIINTEMAKKGKTRVTNDPDFYVAYLAGTDMDAIKVKVDQEGQETIENVPAAAMILILVDAETGLIIRISTAEGEVKELPLEDRKKRLSYAIKKMLSEL